MWSEDHDKAHSQVITWWRLSHTSVSAFCRPLLSAFLLRKLNSMRTTDNKQSRCRDLQLKWLERLRIARQAIFSCLLLLPLEKAICVNCVQTALSFEWERGLGWSCFVSVLTAFHEQIVFFSCYQARYHVKNKKVETKQGRLRPRFYSKARELSTQP